MPCARNVAATWSYQTGASDRGNPVQSRPASWRSRMPAASASLSAWTAARTTPRAFDGEHRVIPRIGGALPDGSDVKLALLQRGQLGGARGMADLHAGQRERGAQLREHSRQQIGGQLQRDAHREGDRPGAVPAGDSREHPVVLGDERPMVF